jgi:hypothetical protein
VVGPHRTDNSNMRLTFSSDGSILLIQATT